MEVVSQPNTVNGFLREPIFLNNTVTSSFSINYTWNTCFYFPNVFWPEWCQFKLIIYQTLEKQSVLEFFYCLIIIINQNEWNQDLKLYLNINHTMYFIYSDLLQNDWSYYQMLNWTLYKKRALINTLILGLAGIILINFSQREL